MIKGILRQEVGWPDQMQARLIIIDEVRRLGSKQEFCQKVGISTRYYNLIMEWLRAPVHRGLLHYFGWDGVYACVEDLVEPKPKAKPGRKPSPHRYRRVADPDQRRAYWRRKQAESRERRRTQVNGRNFTHGDSND